MPSQISTAPPVEGLTRKPQTASTDWSLARPFVVGAKETKEAYPAVQYAAELAIATGSRVHMVSALKPFHSTVSRSIGEQRTTELRIELRELFLEDLVRTVTVPPVWTRIARIGDPADVLASEARDVGAGLIILGAGRHGTVERILSRPTALRVIQKTGVPVVVVPRGAKRARTAVVGIDFSPASLFACRAAAAMLGETGALHLVYVAPMLQTQPILMLPGGMWSVANENYENVAIFGRLDASQSDAQIPRGVRVERVLLTGHVAPALEQYASSIGADLIAVGSHGYNLVQRTLLGSTSAALLARPTVAVLVAPSD